MADFASLGSIAGLGGAIGKAIVFLELSTAKYQAELKAAQAQTVAATSGSGGLGTALGAAAKTGAIALAAAGVAATKFAYDYDKAFQRIDAISNASEKDIESWKNSVLELAGETAQAPTELADALFFLSSAGLDANQIMPALEASAKASAVGLGETADIASIVASALNAYASSGLTAAQATDVLVAAVREGRAEPEEFAGALGRILPIASTIGVTFDQVTASLASLSNIGLDVNEGVTAMRGVFQALAAPGKQAADAMASVGISAQEMLDVIAEEGIVGALRLLDKAVRTNTDGTAAYNNVMRQIVPNVRSLTGVFGLTVQEAEKIDAQFDAVQDSTGSLDEAFQSASDTASFKLDAALNQVLTTLTELGGYTLPVVANGLDIVITGLTQLLATLPGIGPGVGEAAEQAAAIFEALESGQITAVEADAELQNLANHMGLFTSIGGEMEEEIKRLIEVQEQELGLRKSQAVAAEVYTRSLADLAPEIVRYSHETENAVRTTTRFANLAPKAFAEFAEGVGESMQVAIGDVESFEDAFATTPGELLRQSRVAVRVAEQMRSDLKAIFSSNDLTEAQKRALAELAPDQRRAWVEAGNAAKNEIEKNATKVAAANRDATKLAARLAKGAASQGGKELGGNIMSGVATGIRDGAAAAATAGVTAVNEIISRMNRAAQVESPSRLTWILGKELMAGLANGISDAEQKAIDAIVQAVEKSIDRMEDELRKAEKGLDKLRSKASEFQGAIMGAFNVGFGGFGQGEIAGMGVEQFIDYQVLQAQHIADIFEALKRQGASAGLLSQVAQVGPDFGQALLQAGPEAIAQANAALKELQQIAGDTANGLTEDFFGKKLDRLTEEVKELRRDVKTWQHAHDIIVDGDRLAQLVRSHAIQGAGRNGGNTGF